MQDCMLMKSVHRFFFLNKTDSCQTDLLKEKIQSLFSLMEAAVNTASGANKI